MIQRKTTFTAVALASLLLLGACAQSGGARTDAAGPDTAASALATARVQRQTLGQGLYELVYSARQQAVFVTVTGGFGPEAVAPKLLRLDPATLAVQAEIELPAKGFGVALDDAANRLYVGNTTEGSISVIDTVSNRVLGTIKLADKVKTRGPDGKEAERPPHGLRELVLDSARHRLYAPGYAMTGSVLYVVDTQALKLEKVVPGLGNVATGAALDDAGQRLFVSNLAGQLHVIDTATLTISKTLDAGADQPINLAYDAAGKRLFVTDQGLGMLQERRQKAQPDYVPRPGNRVVVLDADSGKTVASLPTGEGPIALRLDPVRQQLFVTNRGAGTVTVFDSRNYQLLQTVQLPDHPNSLAFDAQGHVLYVTVKNGREAAKGSDESVARLAF